MAEMTESHEDSSTLSTNAFDVHFFLRGRRMWPLARKSADPVEACGVVEKRGEELVGEVVEELGGRWAGRQM